VLRAAQRLVVFSALSASIVVAAIITFRSAAYSLHPDVLAWAFTFDLTLTIPLAYWLILVRTGLVPKLSIIPVFMVALALASIVVPRDQQELLRQLRYLAIPLDIALIAIVGRHLLTHRTNNFAIRFAIFELTTLYYGLFGWREKAPEGFTAYKRAGWGSIVGGIILMIGAESIALHLFIQHWSPIVAWVITSLDIYGAIWLIGDYQAMRLRPITIENGVLHIRHGFRWSIDVPLTNIEAVERISGEFPKRRDAIKLSHLDDPDLLIRLREPQMAMGLMGIRREINSIAILPDQDLAAALHVSPV
jgi:hypothetical protein